MSSVAGLFLFLQAVPPRDLVFAMVISYALGFAGMLLAYLNYRKRGRSNRPVQGPSARDEKERPRP